MALRQRTWVILVRPHHINKDKKLHYTGAPRATSSDLGISTSSTSTYLLQGEGEGMEDWNTLETDEGSWVMWYVTTSFPRLREKYKECLELHAKEYTRVVETMPIDTVVTPLS